MLLLLKQLVEQWLFEFYLVFGVWLMALYCNKHVTMHIAEPINW